MNQAMGLRERNKRSRRLHIETIALGLFERDGFEQTTIEHIAKTAGIAPRTFFSYFETKDAIVLADFAQRLERSLEVFDHQPINQPPWVALCKSLALVAHDYELEADQIKRRFIIMARNPSILARNLQLQAGWEQELTNRLVARLGCETGDPFPRLLAASALAVMRSSLQHWLVTEQVIALPTLVQQNFDHLASGLAPDK